MARNLSFLRNNVEKHPCSRGDPGVQPTAVQKSSTGPWLSTVYGVGQWFTVLFAYQLQKLVRAKSGFWSNLDQVCGEGWGCFTQVSPWLLCGFPPALNPLGVRCSQQDQIHPLTPLLVVIPWVGVQEIKASFWEMGEHILTVSYLSFSTGGFASGSVNLVSTEWRVMTQTRRFGCCFWITLWAFKACCGFWPTQRRVSHHEGQQSVL